MLLLICKKNKLDNVSDAITSSNVYRKSKMTYITRIDVILLGWGGGDRFARSISQSAGDVYPRHPVRPLWFKS
jgi:hypothetical protein